MRPVYLTGAGLVSAVGDGVEAHSRGCLTAGQSVDFAAAAQRITARKMVKFMSGSAILMELAAMEALAGVDLTGFAPDRIGLYAATGLAGGNLAESLAALQASCDDDGLISVAGFNRDGLKAVNPLMSFQVLANMPGCIVSVIHRIRGDNLLFNPFEDQGANALYEGVRAIAAGRADAALVLAADDPAHPANLAYLRASGWLRSDDCPNPAGAAVWLTAEPGPSSLAIAEMTLEYDSAPFFDPLAGRWGRTVAAAALMQLILCARGVPLPGRISAGGQTLRWRTGHA